MRKRINVVGRILLFFIVALVLSFAGLVLVTRYALVYPTPENQSAFLRIYDPDEVLKPFISPGHVAQGGTWEVRQAGRRAATIHREINKTFALQGEDSHNLMSQLRDDILSRLQRSEVQVEGVTGNEADGFQFRYVERNGAGRVLLKPVRVVDPFEVRARSTSHPEMSRLPALCAGETPVSVTVVIDETWSRSARTG